MSFRKNEITLALKRFWENAKLFFHASLVDQLYRHSRKDLARKEDYFILICFGDMLGLPMPTYLTMKLLPHLLRDIPRWRRRMSQDRNRLWAAWEEFAPEI
jgi:hypothetical protein